MERSGVLGKLAQEGRVPEGRQASQCSLTTSRVQDSRPLCRDTNPAGIFVAVGVDIPSVALAAWLGASTVMPHGSVGLLSLSTSGGNSGPMMIRPSHPLSFIASSGRPNRSVVHTETTWPDRSSNSNSCARVAPGRSVVLGALNFTPNMPPRNPNSNAPIHVMLNFTVASDPL